MGRLPVVVRTHSDMTYIHNQVQFVRQHAFATRLEHAKQIRLWGIALPLLSNVEQNMRFRRTCCPPQNLHLIQCTV